MSSSAALRRSHSQSHVNGSKPSQDLAGLMLHNIDIEGAEPTEAAAAAGPQQSADTAAATNAFDTSVTSSVATPGLDVSTASNVANKGKSKMFVLNFEHEITKIVFSFQKSVISWATSPA